MYFNDTLINGDLPVPKFFTQDAKSPFITIYTLDKDTVGWYKIEVTSTLDVVNKLGDLDPTNDPDNAFLNTWLKDSTGKKIYGKENPPPGLVYQHSFNVTLAVYNVNATSITDENTRPYLLPKPTTTHKIIAGKAWEYYVGQAFDFENDKVSVSVEMRNAKEFLSFSEQTMKFSIEEGTTNSQTQPVFDIKLTLTDNNALGPLSRIYDFTLVIVKDWKDPIEVALQDARLNEVVRDYEARVYDLTKTSVDDLINSSVDAPIIVNKYTPKLSTGAANTTVPD